MVSGLCDGKFCLLTVGECCVGFAFAVVRALRGGIRIRTRSCGRTGGRMGQVCCSRRMILATSGRAGARFRLVVWTAVNVCGCK